MNQRTWKLITMHKVWQIHTLCVKNKQKQRGGMGLASFENCVGATIEDLRDIQKKIKEKLITAVSSSNINRNNPPSLPPPQGDIIQSVRVNTFIGWSRQSCTRWRIPCYTEYTGRDVKQSTKIQIRKSKKKKKRGRKTTVWTLREPK